MAWSPDGGTVATPCVDHKIYLWDAATGVRTAVLEGATSLGLEAAFHPAGTLLASNGWEGRLRLWDAVLGRPWLDMTGNSSREFSRDGQIIAWLEDKLIPYRVDPALEYRTFTHACSAPIDYARPSIRYDGRLLAVGTKRGVVLWDLERGTELAFLPIGLAWHIMFEPSGDLLTSGWCGVQRWPVRLDSPNGELHIGPPRPLPLPVSDCAIDSFGSGRIVALADHSTAYVVTADWRFQAGPLDDCRGVSISYDGKWLATHSQQASAEVWTIRDGAKVAELSMVRGTEVLFSPDGKWLMTADPPSRLWEVGTWKQARRIGGRGRCFCPDGRQLLVQDSDKVLRLVDVNTGRTLARLESPDLCNAGFATFNPDGSRLVVTTSDSPAVHVWDLRAIRRRLAEMGLDWNAPAYPETDSATETLAASPLHAVVDLGPLKAKVQSILQQEQVKAEVEPLLQQAQQLEAAGKIGEAIVAHRHVARLSPGMAGPYNNLAWLLATAPEPFRNPAEAVEHARRAVELAPGNQLSLNTLGVALYRARNFAESIETLEKSLAAGKGQLEAFDLFFLAMAHHRLGHRETARDCYGRAMRLAAGTEKP